MAAAAALLFAIVNVRNAQPGVPPVGILIDVSRTEKYVSLSYPAFPFSFLYVLLLTSSLVPPACRSAATFGMLLLSR